ncbi:MAG TPA: histidine kinase [Actinocrinis sp.]|jgi:signal transduction histidine kinase
MALDVALVLALAGVAADQVLIGKPADTAALLLLAAALLPLVFRRLAPMRVYAATAAAAVLVLVLDARNVAGVAATAELIALYTVAAHRSRAAALACAAAFELWILALVASWLPAVLNVPVFVGVIGIAAAVTMTGINLQVRRAYLAALEDRARRLERERDQQAQLAAERERARIAREVHDIVAHSLSVMVALADGAAATAPAAPERATGAMRQVADTGRQAIGEMRRLLDTMRADDSDDSDDFDDTDDTDGADDTVPADSDAESSRPGDAPELHPQPGIAQLDDLLDEVRAAGLPTRLTVEGRPRDLPGGVQLAVYRIVQESLTNTRKHACAPTGAQVRLRYLERLLDVEITDDGGRAGPPTHIPAATGTGHGIVGMRERAAVYAGVIDAGPAAHGGWRVHTRLRLGEDGLR